MPKRSTLALSAIFVLLMLVAMPRTTRAYDNDTHFWFTYYLAVKAGFTPVQAAQIASADVSVDYDDDTQPVVPTIESFTAFRHPLNHFQYVRNRLHALPTKSEIIRLAKLPSGYWWDPVIISDPKVLAVARELVNERKVEFWKDTLRDAENPGIFLHYLEDTFSHDGFASYVGHIGYFRIDFMASDRGKAERMAFTTLKYLIAFREVTVNKKSIEQFLQPENLNIVTYLNNARIAEVKAAVQRFSDANPSTGVSPNQLVAEWDKLSEKDRHDRNNVPPPSFLKPTYDIAKDGPSPDSARAREVVMNILGYTRDKLPYIWVYDLKDTGVPEKDEADEAYVYKERDLSRIPAKFTSDDEKDNKDKKKIYDAAKKRQCMPFTLVEASVTIVPFCK